MPRRTSRVGVAAAQLSGIAAGVAQVKRVTEAEALEQVGAVLARLPKAERQRALDLSIVAYVPPGSGRPDVWYPTAAAFLGRAGARPPV